jgi:hypothetical protein
MQVVSWRSAKAIGALLMLLAGSSCTLVEGRDMGPKFENVVLTNDGTAVTNASVSVNGTTANLGADSKYHATLPSTVPVGGRLFLDVGSGPFAIHGLGRVPEAPVITAPADGASFAPPQPIPVTWTSATNPDRFQVNAEYSCGQNCSTSKRYDATGADRSLTIPAGDLPHDLPIVVSVFAYNNGAFNSLAASGSTMNIRGEAFVGYPTITIAEPYHIMGQDMSFKFEHVYVYRGTTQIDNATVSVNGTPAPVGADKGYHATLPASVPVGNPLQLHVAVGATTIAGVGNVPENPVITAPPAGAVLPATAPINVTWSSATDPDRFKIFVGWSCGPNCGTGKWYDATGSSRTFAIAPADLPASVDLQLSVDAYNDGSFTGAADSTSAMNIRGESASRLFRINP